MEISYDFDGGAVDIVSARRPDNIELALRGDSNADFCQWFSFRLNHARRTSCTIRILNAGEATYADGFEDYQACVSDDGNQWFRANTSFDGEILRIDHTPTSHHCHIAYFAPYPRERSSRLLDRVELSPRSNIDILGELSSGESIALVEIYDGPVLDEDKLAIWVTARQHPGETMAEWFAEGLLERLVDPKDATVRALLQNANVFVIPNMNPTGSVLGNQRTNVHGVDLNRSWQSPDEETSAEVLVVQERMVHTGVDLFLDIHGDERNPYVFAAGCEGNPGYTQRIDDLEDRFMNALCDLDTDFQREYGYERDQPGNGDLSAASNWVGESFDCLSLTLEMPFKDNANAPDRRRGWSPLRAKHFGRSVVDSMFVCLDDLR